MYFQRAALIAAGVILLSACASITRGTHEALVVESTPGGAEASLSSGASCITPCSIKLKRKNGVYLSLTKTGYRTLETVVNTEIAGSGAAGTAGNVLLGGLIGAGIDASTGAMNKFVPNPLSVTLIPLGDGDVNVDPVVKPGENFDFKIYAETGAKLPLDKKERKALERAEKKANREAERQAKKDAKAAAKEAKKKSDETRE